VAAISSTMAFCPPPSALHVACEQRLEGLLLLPFRMLGRQRLDAVDDEQELEVERLLGPQRAVVVEDGDAFGGRDEVRGSILRHALDEGHDRLLRRSVVPRRQGILRLSRCRASQQQSRSDQAT